MVVLTVFSVLVNELNTAKNVSKFYHGFFSIGVNTAGSI